MTAAAVLARAHAAGLAVTVEAGNLRLRGPKPPADLLADLRQHKGEVVALLTAPAASAGQAEFEALVERLAVATTTPRPWLRITDREKAMFWAKADARRLLDAQPDPAARLRLVLWEEERASRERTPAG